MSELADQLSFRDQLNSLEKILTLLENDQTPTSRWSALVNKEALAGGQSVLKEQLPKLKAMLDE